MVIKALEAKHPTFVKGTVDLLPGLPMAAMVPGKYRLPLKTCTTSDRPWGRLRIMPMP